MALHRTSFRAPISVILLSSVISAGSLARSDRFGSLSGRLLEEGRRKPVSWAWVCLEPLDDKPGEERCLIAGEGGTFKLDSLEAGLYTITITHVGYRSIPPFLVSIDSALTTELSVALEPMLFKEPRVLVSASRASGIGTGLERVLKGEVFSSKPGVLEDPLRALTWAPGVESKSDIDGRLSFRGGSPGEGVYYLDGLPLPVAYHLGGLTSVFHSSAVEEIISYPAGHPASLGPGTAGFVQVKTRDTSQEGRMRLLELSPISLGGIWQGESNDDRWNAFLSFRRTYHDLVLKALHIGSGVTVPNFFDGQLHVSWRPHPSQSFHLRLLRSGDRVHMALAGLSGASTTNEADLSGDLSRAALAWEGKWLLRRASVFGAALTLAAQPFEYDLRITGQDMESMDWAARSWILSGQAFWQSEKHRLEIGGIRIRQLLGYNVHLARGFWKLWMGPPTEGNLSGDPVSFSLSGTSNAGYHSWYVQERWKPLGGSWVLTGGIREESFLASGEKFISPRISLRYSFGPISVHAAWGVYRGHPLDQPGDPASTEPGLRCRKAVHLVAGVRQVLGRWGSLGVELYKRSSESLASEVEPGVFKSVGEGRALGFEVSWTRQGQRWSSGVNYTYGRSFLKEPLGPVVRQALIDSTGANGISWAHAAPGWYPGPFDPGHSVRLFTRCGLGGGVSLGLSWAYRSGNRITPITGIVRDSKGRAFGLEGIPGSERLPAYHRLDARLEKFFRSGRRRWKTFLEVTNIYNRANVFQAFYNKDYTGRNEYRMLPLIPSAGVSVEF